MLFGAKRNAYANLLASALTVSLLFELPYCRISSLTERDIAKRQTASLYLRQLVDIGVLEEREAGKEKLFIHPKLMQLLIREDNKIAAYT